MLNSEEEKKVLKVEIMVNNKEQEKGGGYAFIN